MPSELADDKKAVLEFIHVTDTHFLDQAEESFHNINTKESFESVLSHIQSNYPDIDFLLLTGDVSQTGSQQSYTLFKSVIKDYQAPVYCVPGNHDVPILLQKTIANSPNESISIIQLGKFSLVLINSWVDSQHYGEVSPSCLEQLEKHLLNNSDQFHIVALHHPPVFINSKWLDELGLQNKNELLEIIKKYSPTTLLLFGHIHQEIDLQLDSLRLLSTPSTCYQFKPNSEFMQCLNTPLPAYRVVSVSFTKNHTNSIDTKVHYVE